MDYDSLFISSLLRSKKPAYLKGLSPSYFIGEWKKVFIFVRSFYSQFKQLPRLSTVKDKFRDLSFTAPSEKAPYYAKELVSRYGLSLLDEGLQDSYVNHREKGDLPGSLQALKEVVLGVQRVAVKDSGSDGGLLRVNDNLERRKKDYLYRQKKKGLLGIPTRWPTLNRVTQGWQPGDLAVFLARPGVGKTFWLLLQAIDAQLSGKNGLLASMEMYPKRLVTRYDALGAGISPERLRKGALTDGEKKKLDGWYTQLQADDMGKLDLAGPNEISSPLDLELAINLGQYDFVLWDSFYLASREKKWEAFAQLVADLKRVAARTGVPILLSSQFNKDVKTKHESADISAAAFTDSIVQDADFVFALFQTPPMKLMREIILRSLKVREGVALTELLAKWDLDAGKFNEINATVLSDQSGDPEIDNEEALSYEAP